MPHLVSGTVVSALCRSCRLCCAVLDTAFPCMTSILTTGSTVVRHAAGHISIDMLPVEARSMQPAERSPRVSAAAAAAAAALAAQLGSDVEQGRQRPGPVSTNATGSRRRGLPAWVMGEDGTRHPAPT